MDDPTVERVEIPPRRFCKVIYANPSVYSLLVSIRPVYNVAQRCTRYTLLSTIDAVKIHRSSRLLQNLYIFESFSYFISYFVIRIRIGEQFSFRIGFKGFDNFELSF